MSLMPQNSNLHLESASCEVAAAEVHMVSVIYHAVFSVCVVLMHNLETERDAELWFYLQYCTHQSI